MPVMDGLAAARAWRLRERERRDGRHLPILALTANAMTHDRAQCLEAGMDDHLAKPLDPQTLYDRLERWTAPRRSSAAPAPAPAPAPATQAAAQAAGLDLQRLRDGGLEVDAALARVLGRAELYASMVEQFRRAREGHLHDVGRALRDGDRTAAVRAAHTTRGLAALLGADALAAAAGQVEAALHGGDDAIAQALGRAMAQQDALLALLDEASAAARPAGPPRPEGDSAPPLRELRRLLASDDPRAQALFEQHRIGLRQALGTQADAVERALQDFELHRALELLPALDDAAS